MARLARELVRLVPTTMVFDVTIALLVVGPDIIVVVSPIPAAI